jgi:hypothetical protein
MICSSVNRPFFILESPFVASPYRAVLKILNFNWSKLPRAGQKPTSVGALLLNRNANGMGSPGAWDSSGSEPVWIAAPQAPTGLTDVRLPRPLPLRDLLPNEKLQTGLMGASVVRTDLQQQANEQNGQFTPDDRATLQAIYRIVSR